MPEEFTVTKVKFAGEKPNPHGGTLYKFYVSLAPGEDELAATHDVYWQRKSRELDIGELFYGHIEQGEYGPRFKTDQRPDGGNFQTPPNLRVRSGPPGQAPTSDPQAERSRRIERQHSQEMALRALGRWTGNLTGESYRQTVKDWTDWFVQDLDADVGSGQAAHGASPNSPPVDGDAADLSAETQEVEAGGGNQPRLEEPPAEASPAQKGTLTKLFHEAGLSRDAMKAVVLFRCGSEKATKQGASQLITDLQDGATHDALLAEIYDAHRAGNPLGTRAAALIPTEVPWDGEGLPPAPAKDEENVPF